MLCIVSVHFLKQDNMNSNNFLSEIVVKGVIVQNKN